MALEFPKSDLHVEQPGIRSDSSLVQKRPEESTAFVKLLYNESALEAYKNKLQNEIASLQEHRQIVKGWANEPDLQKALTT